MGNAVSDDVIKSSFTDILQIVWGPCRLRKHVFGDHKKLNDAITCPWFDLRNIIPV